MQTVFSSSRAVRRWRFAMAALVFGAAGLPVWGACPSELGRFVPQGAEVTDTKTGLIWARCSVGQTWTGYTCAGEATLMSYNAALEYAASLGGWRLPNRKELFSLADKGCVNPAIDSTAFPNTPGIWYRTSTPRAGHPSYAWGIYFHDGHPVGGAFRTNGGAVRLVRSSE